MRMKTRGAVLGALAALALLAVPAAANAAFVGPSVGGSGTSCRHTRYEKIQEAIENETPGSTITVCPGSYTEQLVIEKEMTIVGRGHPTVVLPDPATTGSSTCDAAINAANPYAFKDEELVSICGPVTVAMKGVTLEPKWPGSHCSTDNLYGILIAGGATLDASKVNVDGGGAYPINGCQTGVSIEVGWGYEVDEPGHLTLEKSTIENYQKNGITVDGEGSTATIGHDVITGAGPVAQGQNGIQISRGAIAAISRVKVMNNECNIVDVCGSSSSTEYAEDGAGVLFYEPGTASNLSESQLAENDIGVEYVGPEPPATSEISLSNDRVQGGYLSVQVNQGKATLTEDKLSEALIGLDFNSYEYGDDSFGPTATATGDKISGTDAAIQVESDLSGKTGSLAISGGRIRGFIDNFDPDFTITD